MRAALLPMPIWSVLPGFPRSCDHTRTSPARHEIEPGVSSLTWLRAFISCPRLLQIEVIGEDKKRPRGGRNAVCERSCYCLSNSHGVSCWGRDSCWSTASRNGAKWAFHEAVGEPPTSSDQGRPSIVYMRLSGT